MNELNLETSPYLLQHASNPIYWKAWNENTLKKAINQNKLLVISIGYSACHWCHVMEHETFENQEVANTMNPNYIAIKVDREERPDIDAVYMKAVQIMTNRGGWPLNVVCLPDGRPFWGGTYFKKEEWLTALQQLQEIFVTNPERIIDYAEKLHEGINQFNIAFLNPENKTTETIDSIVSKWEKSFDLEYGGYTRAPKFMMPSNYQFLQYYAYVNKNTKLTEYVDLTLTKMAYGGIFDTVDGGFSRYSVDMRWHVSHFEKMLYDNAQLVSLYSQAYKRSKNPLYQEVIEKTLLFVEREFLSVENAFYSALDADSLNKNNILEEGAFYVWTISELQEIITQDFNLFSELFNVNSFGYWEHENYVLIQTKPLELLAETHKITVTELKEKKENWENKLYEARQKRSKPRLDDKCLTSWNALMIKGYVQAYMALENSKYLEIARKNARFIIAKQWSPEGHLYHSYKEGKSTIVGFLEDYAFTIEAFINLYQATLEEEYVRYAKHLLDYCLDNFYNTKEGFFAFNAQNTPQLISSHFEIEDNVIPSSNSVMASNLAYLAICFNNAYYENISNRMLQIIIPTIDYGSAYSNWLTVWLSNKEFSKELAICGENALQEIAKINKNYFPELKVAGSTKNSILPFLENRFLQGETFFYLCKNKSCNLPKKSFSEILRDLEN